MAEPLRLWIGGSTGSGKSTLAYELAESARLSVYSVDDRWDAHVAALPGSVTERVAAMPVCDRLSQHVQVQAEAVWAIAEDRWPLILGDLAAIRGPVVVEGEAILPAKLASRGVPTHIAMFLVVSPQTRLARYSTREWAHELVANCVDPSAALESWMARDELTDARIRAAAAEHGYPIFETDTEEGRAAARAYALR